MKYAPFFLLLLFASCARRPANTPPPPKSEPIGMVLPRNGSQVRLPDTSNVVVQTPRTLLDKVLGRNQPLRIYPAGTPVVAGKKSTITINHVVGNQSNATTTVGKKATAATAEGATAASIGKAKGPTAIGDSATAQDFTKQGQRGGAAASGAGATATATTIKPPTPWLKYGLWALGGLATYWVVFGGGGAVLLALWRRNKPTSNQV